MSKSHDGLSRHLVFSPDNPTGECNEWCAPLHQFQERIAHLPLAKFFDIDDFMCMGGWRRPGRPLLILSKHRDTRRYLNVDMAGDVWKLHRASKSERRQRRNVPTPQDRR